MKRMIRRIWNDVATFIELAVRFGFAGFAAVTLSIWIVAAMTVVPVLMLFWIVGLLARI